MTVKEQASSCLLGRQIFEAWRTAYQRTADDWESLPLTERRRYVQIAQAVLLDMTPREPVSPYFALVADAARAQAAHVIGRITPSEPYGVSEDR